MRKYLSLFVIVAFLLISIFVIKNRGKIKSRFLYYFGIIKNKAGGNAIANCENCDVLFDDGINNHAKAYKKEKITEQDTDGGLKKLERSGVLKKIVDNEFYLVADLDYSQPLLLPKAISFLNDLSVNYKAECVKNKSFYVPFLITSATRSRMSVSLLRKKNPNAIKESAHLNGKTIDISYMAFAEHRKQLQIFVSVLSDMKKQNKCFVKYEKNGCLHLTVN